MNLRLQIISLIISFIYGFSLSLILLFNKKIIYNKIRTIKYFGSFFIIILGTFTYFIIMQHIINNYFHPYQLLMIILGFVCQLSILKKI